MKKILIGLMMLSYWYAQGQCVGFTDGSSNNHFLALDMPSCSVQGDSSSKNYQKPYDCGNDSVASVLHVNFLSPEFMGKQLYVFNNFMYWLAQNQSSQQAIKAQEDSQNNFSGSGVFMMIIGTSAYLRTIFLPKKSCPDGQTLVMAQLKYNDGHTLVTWSQDAICCASTDNFTIAVTSDQDTAWMAESKRLNGNNKWMQDPGPSANYSKAHGAPRKVRLVLQK